jgi:hypothetical protein
MTLFWVITQSNFSSATARLSHGSGGQLPSLRRSGCHVISVHVGFVLDKVAMGWVFEEALDLSPDRILNEIFYHWSHNIYFLSYSSWLIMKINFGWILRYITSILGTVLISINYCHIWLFIIKAPFIWVLRYITIFHLK